MRHRITIRERSERPATVEIRRIERRGACKTHEAPADRGFAGGDRAATRVAFAALRVARSRCRAYQL